MRVHPFPSRTRKLSSSTLTILGWKRPGKISRRQHKTPQTNVCGVFRYMHAIGNLHRRGGVPPPVRSAHNRNHPVGCGACRRTAKYDHNRNSIVGQVAICGRSQIAPTASLYEWSHICGDTVGACIARPLLCIRTQWGDVRIAREVMHIVGTTL